MSIAQVKNRKRNQKPNRLFRCSIIIFFIMDATARAFMRVGALFTYFIRIVTPNDNDDDGAQCGTKHFAREHFG